MLKGSNMTHPDSPKSPTQKYYLTSLGKVLLQNEANGKHAEGVSEERVNRLIAEFTNNEASSKNTK